MEQAFVNSITLFASGALLSGITTYLSHRYAAKRDLKNHELNQVLQSKKLVFDADISYKEDLNKSIQEIYKILFNFEHYVSLTSSIIYSHGKLTVEEFDNSYRQESEQLAHVKSLVFAKISQYSDDVIKISGHHNSFWGFQRILIGIDIKNDKENYRVMQKEVIKTSNEMHNRIHDLIYKIQKISENINDK